MGRPIKKKFFGSDNVNDSLVYSDAGGEGVASITTSVAGTLYSKGISATVAVSPIGGTRATISSITTDASGLLLVATVGVAGTGYTSAPVVTLVKPANVATTITTYTASATATVGTIAGLYLGMAANVGFAATNVITQIHSGNSNIVMSGTTTGVIVANVVTIGDIGSAGSLTAVLAATTTTANTIQANAWVTGGTIGKQADIVSQRSSRRYRTTNADGTSTTRLVPTLLNLPTVAQVVAAGGPTALGEMTILATDSAGGIYLVGKLEGHTALLFPAAIGGSAGTQFAANTHVQWTSTGVAVVNSGTATAPSALAKVKLATNN